MQLVFGTVMTFVRKDFVNDLVHTESRLSTVQRVVRNLKRWREGDQPLHWTAIELLEAEKKFRRITGYQGILLLRARE